MDSISVTSYDMDQSYSIDDSAMDSLSVTSYDMDQSYCSAFSLNDSPSVIYGHHLVEDDNNTVVSAFYHDEVDEDESDELDDAALSELINKLRNGGSSEEKLTEEEPSTEAAEAELKTEKEDKEEAKEDEESQDSDEDMTDDVIAKHLKALNRTTKKRSKYNVIDDDGDDVSETDAILTDDEDMSYFTDTMDGESSDEEDDDDDDDDEAAYAEVDEMMKKLGVESIDKDENRKWLETMSQQGACDFRGAPQTISSKKKWLVSLAAELMQEDSSDEDSDVSIEKQEVDNYEVNMKQLEKAAQEAQMLIENTGEEAQTRQSAEKAVQEARLQTGPSKRLQQTTRANEWQKRQWKKNNTAPIQFPAALTQQNRFAQPYQRPVTARAIPFSPRKNFNNITQNSKRTNPVVFPRKQLVAVPEEEPSHPGPHTETRSAVQASVRTQAIGNPAASPEMADVKTTDKSLAETPAATPNTRKNEPIEKRSVEDTKSSVVATTPSKARPSLNDKESTNTAGVPNVEIPPGFPPYPGFGPKWPWHPNSPRAPAGYRECYMLHMGEFYNQYMEYLQARAGSMKSAAAKGEKIMKVSLSSQAAFKPLSKKTKDKLSNYPQLASNRSSKPLSARKNSVVPVSKPKPKTDDASDSSGSSANAEELFNLIKTKPDLVAVGRVHKKSKGKKGKVILISGNELDKQAREKEKKSKMKATEASYRREEQKSKGELDVKQEGSRNEMKTSTHSENTKTQLAEEMKSKVIAFPEQPVVAETKCSCAIM